MSTVAIAAIANALEKRKKMNEGYTEADLESPEQKEKDMKVLSRAGLLWLILVIVAMLVAIKYNSNERNGLMKWGTIALAFFFPEWYLIYFIIRAGILGRDKALNWNEWKAELDLKKLRGDVGKNVNFGGNDYGLYGY